MQGIRFKARRLPPVLVMLVLAACGTTPTRQIPITQVGAAAQLEQEGRYAEAAALNEKLAAGAAEAQRVEFLVAAAQDWLSAGNLQRSSELVRPLKEKGLYPALAARLELVRAGIDLAAHQPQQALDHLRFSFTPLPTELRARALLLRGQAHLALGDVPAAVEDWTERDNEYAPGSTGLAANRDLIWKTLSETHTAVDLSKLPANISATARGWLELAAIAGTGWQQPEKFVEQLKDWQARYPNHPAQQQLVPGLIAKQEALTAFPPKIAVLLPLSGNYQSPADAVRDGLLAAYYQVGGANPPAITLYDSGTTAASAVAAYQKAVSDGANMVVGPLTKDAVAGVAAQASLPTPVLALNYLDAGRAGPGGFYQFGLLPEGEAAQAAERAVAEGRTHAVALVSGDELGSRMFKAFSARFSELGGVLLDMQTFTPRGNSYADILSQLFGLDASESREQHLAATIDQRLEYEPRRRQDIQFVFLVASADDARQIQPQIGYYHAEDLPVYSTSRVYELDENVDNTVLDGITFDDMPWTLEDKGSVAEMRDALQRDWPNNFPGNSRLYALGFDAYRLLPLLYNTHGIGEPLQGVTGLLSLDPGGRVHRKLDWADFEDGSPELLPPVDLPANAPPAAGTPVSVPP